MQNQITANPTEAHFKQYQVVQRKDGFFSRSTEIIFKKERFKSEGEILDEQKRSITEKKPLGGSIFSSVKVTNIRIDGQNNTLNIRF